MNVGRIRNGAILLSAGVVLLLNTTGYLSWSVWLKIFSLWPVALIAIGIELLFKKSRLAFIAILSPLLFFATILGPAFLYESGFREIYRTSRTYSLNRELDPAFTDASATIRLYNGDLRVSSGAGQLISAELDYFNRRPYFLLKQGELDQSVTLHITDRDRRWFSGRLGRRWFRRPSEEKRWEIKLTDQIPVSLNLYVRTSEAVLDFSELKLQDLDLEAKDSDVDVKMGNQSEDATAKILSRGSKVAISVPEDLGIRIINRTKFSFSSFSWFALEEKEDGYQTPDFEQAARKLTLYLEGSLTELRMRKYQPFEGI
jgi:hypothetical protein